LTIRPRAQIAHTHCAGSCGLGRTALHLDQAHATIPGDGKPLMETETRDLSARRLRGLEQREVIRNLDFLAVDLDDCHALQSRIGNLPAPFEPYSAATIRGLTLCELRVNSSMRRSISGRKCRMRPWT